MKICRIRRSQRKTQQAESLRENRARERRSGKQAHRESIWQLTQPPSLGLPLVFGPGSNFLFLGCFVASHFVLHTLLAKIGISFGGMNKEFDRDLNALDKRKREVAMRSLANLKQIQMEGFENLDLKTDEDMAHIVFRRLDVNGDGKLQTNELRQLVVMLGYPPSDANKLLAKWDEDGSGDISFQEFYTQVWNFQKCRNKIYASNRIVSVPEREVPDDEMASIVYKTLALEEGGEELGVDAISQLLLSWALPASEVKEYMSAFDDNHDGFIDLDEFKAHFKPFYHYAYLLLASDMDNYHVISRRKESLVF